MLHIPFNSLKILKARKRFHEEMRLFVFKRIDDLSKLKNEQIRNTVSFFDLFVNDEIDNILIGQPAMLASINDD